MDLARLIRQIHWRNSHRSERGGGTSFGYGLPAAVLGRCSIRSFCQSLTLPAIRPRIHPSISLSSRDARSSEFRVLRLRPVRRPFRFEESGSVTKARINRSRSSKAISVIVRLFAASPRTGSSFVSRASAVRLYLDHVMYHFFGLFRKGQCARVCPDYSFKKFLEK